MGTDKKNNNFLKAMSEGRLQELRKIITGLDQEELKYLSKLIQDPEAFSDEISSLLPLSIKKMIERGSITIADLLPLIEEVLKESIKKDPQSLANILFPVMIPAIRKAVSEDIKRMLDSLNTTMEHGFSPKRIGWRFKAMFSGKSYAEIILSNAYIFRVKQVFLIHRKTGLLLNQVSDEEGGLDRDADMVSSMLSAIKDFVQDSFKVEENQELNTIRVGDFNIWIEQGPYAIIAAIVEGNAPEDLRLTMKESIEAIHVNFSYELEHFEGDTTPFESKDRFLRLCLQNQKKEEKKKKPVIVIVIFVILLGLLGYWSYLRIDQKLRFNKYVENIKQLPGLIITDYGRTGGNFFVKGMKDPLATDPVVFFNEYGFDSSTLKLNLIPYISLDKEIVLRKVKQMLKPPETIQLEYNSDTLFASGQADQSWVDMAINKMYYFPIVDFFDISGLENSKIKEKVTKSIKGIEPFYFVFQYNNMEMDSIQKKRFMEFVQNVKNVIDFTSDSDSVPVILITSHTSYKGNTAANERVANRRIKQYINMMTEEGISSEFLRSKVNFIEDIDEGFPVRSVSFKVEYIKR